MKKRLDRWLWISDEMYTEIGVCAILKLRTEVWSFDEPGMK